MSLSLLVLLVSCQANSFAIELDANGGVLEDTSIEITEGEFYVLPTPYLAGYVFEGWYLGEVKVELSGNWSYGEASELKAQWKYGEYQITYDAGGGVLANDNPTTYTYDTDDFTMAPPTKDGGIFSHWIDQKGNKYQSDFVVKKGSEGDLNLTAVWWNYIDENGVKYARNGDSLEVVEYVGDSYSGFSIPSSCYGVAVTSIADNAFNGLGTKTILSDSFFRIEIPQTITKIGKNAFSDCTDVKVLVVFDDMQNISNSQQYMTQVNQWLTNVEIGEGNTDLVDVIKQERPAIGNSIVDKTN